MVKSNICNAILAHLERNKDETLNYLESLQQSLHAESKSSAGDKHETARAMIHQEMRQTNDTLMRCEQALNEAKMLGQSTTNPRCVAPGVLVVTDGPWVLIGIALGKIELEGHIVIGVSPEAPVAKAWRGLEVGNEVSMGPNTYAIKGLY